jgi:hypothetical protein
MDIIVPASDSKNKTPFWKPNPKQELFLSIPHTIKEAMYGGGAGSGKSDVLLLYGVLNRWHENPKFKQVFMRRTTPELKKEIVPRTREFYRHFGATFNATDMAWTFPRPDQYGSGMHNAGAMIFLSHCEEEKDVKKFDSMEISLYTPDEITSLTEYIYLYIGFERNRSPKGSGLPSIIRAAGMPGGIGHTFVKKRFIDPAPEGGKIIIGKGGNKRIYIHSTQADNKDHIDPTYEQSLRGRPEAEMKAKLFGDWTAYQGQVFSEFRTKKYPDEPENALHVIPPFDIPEWWPRMIIGDWGYTAMTYIGFYAISPKKRLYLYRELYWYKTDIAIWAPIVKGYLDKENVKVVKFCQSASQQRGQEHTIQQQIENELGQSIELSVNSAGSRVAGKMMIHEYLRFNPKPTIPNDEQISYDESYAMWLQRNKTPEEYQSYLNLFIPPEPEDNLPKLQIFQCEEDNHDGHPNCCPVMIDAIRAASYDKPRENKAAEDIAEFQGDDPLDDLRYAVDSAEAYFKEAEKEFEKIQKQEELMRKFALTNDVSGYYRNMRTLEAKPKMQVVARYRRH